jgi:hypothetical protein
MTIYGITFSFALVNMSLRIKKKHCHFVHCSEIKLPAQIQITIAFRIVDIEEKQILNGGNPYICCSIKQYDSLIL